jgi:hypothetical protein
MVTLQLVDVTLVINGRPQAPLRMTPVEAREFMTMCIADDTPAVRYVNGNREWLLGYTKDKLIDGQGNIISRKDIPRGLTLS